jgi:hypothetical protein
MRRRRAAMDWVEARFGSILVCDLGDHVLVARCGPALPMGHRGVSISNLSGCSIPTRYPGGRPAGELSRSVFHVLTVCTQMCWLLSYLAFAFGVHAFPMV